MNKTINTVEGDPDIEIAVKGKTIWKSKPKMKFALIGRGGMGKRWEGVIRKHAQLDAIVDPENLGTHTLEEALGNKEIDAVLIATPHRTLASITKKALKAGKHVLCEKPGGMNPEEIRSNAELAIDKGLTYMVGYNHRFHDGFIKAHDMYRQGLIGDIVFIRARYGFGGREGYDKEWRLNRRMGGSGELIDQGVHMIDLVLSFIGLPDEIKGFTSDTFWKKGNKDIGEDNAFVLLKGENKELASIHVSLTQWKPMHNFEIYGTEGSLSIEGLGQRYGGNEKGDEQLIFCKRKEDFDRNIKGRVIECNPVADDSLMLMLKEFVLAVKEERPPVPSPLDALKTLKVTQEVYRQQ